MDGIKNYWLSPKHEKPLSDDVFAQVISGEYIGWIVQLKWYLEQDSKGDEEHMYGHIYYATDSVPNEYTGYYRMWFREDELEFLVEDEGL